MRTKPMVLPLVEQSDGRWVTRDSRLASAVLVPALSLGRRVLASRGSGADAGTLSLAEADMPAGGPALFGTSSTF